MRSIQASFSSVILSTALRTCERLRMMRMGSHSLAQKSKPRGPSEVFRLQLRTDKI